MDPVIIAAVGLGWATVALVVWSVLYASGEREEDGNGDV